MKKMINQGPKIRCYVIADDYRWHFFTDSLEEFFQKTKEYLELMSNSQKENQFHFRNFFLTEIEYEITVKNFLSQTKPRLKPEKNSDKKRPNLYLVD
jgi:hypothetical protein